ncbi:hypothetical protein [Nocardia amamiensis]|uniref:hypothetical protein n=1 Tax=Nocardia amamiensis TaxID=404578 RepID=UPI001FE13974|nr:hypothetical protein [Nocardia amamiensis]
MRDEIIVVGLGTERHRVSKAPARKRVPIGVEGQPPGLHRKLPGRPGEGIPGGGIECTGFEPVYGVRQLLDGKINQLGSASALILLNECIDTGQEPMDVAHADSAGTFGDEDRDSSGRSQLAELTPLHVVLDFPRSSPEITCLRWLVCARDRSAAENRMPVQERRCTRESSPEPFELAGVESAELLVERGC